MCSEVYYQRLDISKRSPCQCEVLRKGRFTTGHIPGKRKKLHRQFLLETKDVEYQERWLLLMDVNLKRETESLIISAREQTIKKII